MIIGSHVKFNNEQLLASVKEAITYGANTFMFYTGAPQNTKRSAINDMYTLEAYNLMKENNIALENVICHAPYIVNLANRIDESKYRFSKEFLRNELDRCELLNVKYLVLHPGSAVGQEPLTAITNIIDALNDILKPNDTTMILLETMAGKGTEIGSKMEEIDYILKGINLKDKVGVCLDTCHLNDSGIDLPKFDEYLDIFDKHIGINKIKCIHINDSKNDVSSHKDRHENIGLGTIGFDNLIKVIYNKRLENIPFILETPYICKEDNEKEKIYPPYKFEISMIRNKAFNSSLLEDIRNYYK